MIKRLRRRFIIIMMALITIVLAVTFTSQIITSANDMKTSSLRNLDQGMPKEAPDLLLDVPPEKKDDFMIRPFDDHSPFSSVYITYTDDLQIIDIKNQSGDFSSEHAVEILESALKQDKTTGVLSAYELRYKIFNTDNPDHIIGFIDISYERSFIAQQIINYAIIGLASLGAFFIISLILSKIAVKPIASAWEKQQQFVADASHELKTPITIMLTNTSILLSEKNEVPGKARKWIVYIEQEAKQMRKLVEDLLFLARLDAVDQKQVFSPIDLSDVVSLSALPFEPLYFESGKTLESEITPKLSIYGDAVKIKQLVSILLDNALKFSLPDSEVKLALKKENDKAVLTVSNPCVPIEKEGLTKIFDRFYRMDSARTRGSNSYGLGLAIAKEIVELLGGRITVKSGSDDMLTFTVIFPLISPVKSKKSHA